METSATAVIHHILFLLIFIFALGMVSGRLAQWLKIPDVVLFIVAGMIVGQGFHLIHETSASLTNQLILTAGSALILFDGGRNIRLSGLKKVWISLSLLSVTGVVITVAVVGVATKLLFGLDWLYALLIGSIIASTDPASIIPVFKQVKIREKVRETVESESAFNDATGSIMTFAVLGIIMGTGTFSLADSVLEFLKMAFGGIAVGCIVSFAAAYLVAHFKLGLLREYTTIAMIVTALASYLLGDTLHVSGFMATFAAGLIWGNSHLFGLHMSDKRHEMDHFSDNVTVIMRMLIFILLGSQVDFAILYQYLWPSIAVVLVLMFIARPLTVYASALPDLRARWTRNELLFMIWVRETGVIPAALSGLVAGLGIAHADIVASVTFMAIMLTILVQASTTAWLARKLGLEEKTGSQKH